MFQVMGIIILIILVLLGFSSAWSRSEEAGDAWRPQSQVQMSRRQTDLQDMNLRKEMKMRPHVGGRSLSPGTRADDARSKPPRRSPELGKLASSYDSHKDASGDDGEDEAELDKLVRQQQIAKLFGLRAQKLDAEEDDADDDEDDIGVGADMNSDIDDKADGFMSLYHSLFDSDDDLFPQGASQSARVYMYRIYVNLSAPECMYVKKAMKRAMISWTRKRTSSTSRILTCQMPPTPMPRSSGIILTTILRPVSVYALVPSAQRMYASVKCEKGRYPLLSRLLANIFRISPHSSDKR